MNYYPGSLAQQYINFSALTSIQTNPGEQFGKAMVFIDSTTASGVFLSTPPAPNDAVELTSQNYTDFVSGGLLAWLNGYFASNSIANIFVTVWDSSITAYSGLHTAYNAWKYDAYFKTLYTAGLGSESLANAACVALAEYAFTDIGVASQIGFGTTEADNLIEGSPTSLATALLGMTAGDALLVYGDASETGNPWLDQLGLTLGALNATGTAVGNALDYKATLNRQASGTDGDDLTAAQVTSLKNQNVGYWAYTGSSSGTAALYNPTTLFGRYAGAEWFIAYIDFVASIKAIEFLTDPATPQGKRRNNDNYQAILTLLNSVAQPFSDNGGIGVVQDFTTKNAPQFSQLTGGGDTLIVPNAWTATYLQGIREITVQGTLYIQA